MEPPFLACSVVFHTRLGTEARLLLGVSLGGGLASCWDTGPAPTHNRGSSSGGNVLRQTRLFILEVAKSPFLPSPPSFGVPALVDLLLLALRLRLGPQRASQPWFTVQF